MLIVLEDNHKLRLSQVFPQQEEILYKHFSIRDPKAIYAKSAKSGGWDGIWRKYNRNSQTLKRPFLAELIELCKEHNFPYEIIDQREKSKYPRPSVGSFDNTLIDGIVLRDNQMDALNAVSLNGNSEKDIISEVGMIAHTTGSGKTNTMAGIIKLFRCPTVIITEQVVVLDQIVKNMQLKNVVHNNDIGLFTSGFTPNNNIVIIGSVQALQTPKKPIWSEFEVKLTTVERDFYKLMIDNCNKAYASVGELNAKCWFRTIFIDKFIKNNQEIVETIHPEIKNDYFKAYNILINNKEYLSKYKEEEIELFLLDINIKPKEFELCIEKAINIFIPVIKDKYFQIAIKGYHSRFEKSQLVQKLVEKCELLMIDEADKGSSKYYEPLFNTWFNGRYIYGFSGTPYDRDKPVENLILRERFGSILSETNRKEMTEVGNIQPIKYYMIQFGKEDPMDKTAFDIAEKREIINNNEFHKKIEAIINSFKEERFLILIDTAAVEEFGKTLEQKINGSIFISGQTIRSKRNKVLKDFEEGNLKVLIGSKILKRGLDLHAIDNMIMIGAGKKESNIDQIIGRAVRKTERGWSRVFAFYHTANYYLLTHSRRQLKFVVGLKQYPVTIIYGNKQITGEKFIKNRYKVKLY